MAVCYHRKVAWLTLPGDLLETPRLVFRKPSCPARLVTVPCGKCVACRVNNAASWAIRASHEAEYVGTGCFVTLTYAPEHCPKDYQLRKDDFQRFMKRLRRDLPIRAFFAVGEYGSKFGRPHYHALVLGWSPDDLEFFATSYSGCPIYTSKFLESKWGKGFCPVGTMSCASAAYVARYSKKCSAPNHGNRVPPFFLASRNIRLSNGQQGALGAQWVLDHHKALRLGYVSHPSKPDIHCRIPDYYFDLLQRWYPDEYLKLRALRYDFAMDKQCGFYLVEDPFTHEPSAMFGDDYGYTDDDLRELQEYTGLRDEKNFDILLSAAAKVVKAQSNAQDERLGMLRRNME